MEGPAYLLLDEHGEPIAVASTIEEGLSLANDIDPSGRIYLDAPTEQDFALIEAANEPSGPAEIAANPEDDPYAESMRIGRHLRPPSSTTTITRAPGQALKAFHAAVDRPLDFEAAKSMPLDEAHQRLRPLFPRFRGTGRPVHAYDQPGGKKGMANHILGQNYKTAKTTPPSIIRKLREDTGFGQASVLGLSLLPSTQSYASRAVQETMASARRDYGIQTIPRGRLNACVRATPQCASSCLVFSGRNMVEGYNTAKKYALTQALIREPQAFLRMLIENIRIHRDTSFRANRMPLVRLNVFSDLPWELMAPELFDEFADVQFYDYTKVPGRQPPSNYDLTFSFAGTAANVRAVDYEIRQQGRRVAVVFAATALSSIRGLGTVPITPTYHRAAGSKKRRLHARLPKDFLGLPVIDGDVSDMRPYDPAPSIVGLTWKNPRNQNVTVEHAKVFIVLVDMVQGAGGYYDAIVSKTARFDGVDYSKYAASKTD